MYKRSLSILSTLFITFGAFSQSASFDDDKATIVFDRYVEQTNLNIGYQNENSGVAKAQEEPDEAIIEIDLSKLRITAKKLSILLPNGDTLKFKNEYIETTVDEKLMWMGRDKDKNNAEIYLIHDEGELNATFSYNGRQYSLTQLNKTQFSISSVKIINTHDEWRVNTDGAVNDNGMNSKLTLPNTAKQAIANSQSNGINVIRLLAVKDVGLSNTTNLYAGIQAIKDAIRNSHLDQYIQVDHVATIELDIPTPKGILFHSMLAVAQNGVPGLTEAREYYGVDVALLFTDAMGAGGIVSTIGASTKNNSFYIVDKDAMPIVHSHEFGHVLGARHSNDPAGTYEHGYTLGWLFNTILGTDNGAPHINYYSTPDYSYNGRVLGTASKNDVRRKMIEWAPIVAGIDDKQSAKMDAPALNVPPMACYGQNSLFWTKEYGIGNVRYELYRSNDRSMSNAFLQYSGPNLGTSMNILSFASHRHVAVKACDNSSCSNYSNVETLSYFNGCP